MTAQKTNPAGKEIESVEREDVAREDLEDALKQVLLAETDKRPPSENREPTRDELRMRFKLQRKK